MKKAYNVCKDFGEGNFGFMTKTLSLVLIFFFGLSVQSTAQSLTATAGTDQREIKTLDVSDYEFNNINGEQLGEALRDYAASNIALQGDDPVGEVEFEASMMFLRSVSIKLDLGESPQAAVLSSYQEVINSPLAKSHPTVDVPRRLQRIMDALN